MCRLSLLIALLLPAACAPPPPPLVPAGPWSGAPESNDWNLKVTVANPHDLFHGDGTTDNLGREASPPVERLFTGKRQALPDLSTQQVYGSSASSQPAASSNAGQ